MHSVNYWAVLVCAVLSMVVGAIWYGPLFGKAWMWIVGATAMDVEERKKMQQSAKKLYLVQFLITLFQVWVIARLVGGSPDAPQDALWMWAAFIVPTLAGVAMWNNDSRQVAWARFLISAGYQLVLFVMFGMILGIWA